VEDTLWPGGFWVFGGTQGLVVPGCGSPWRETLRFRQGTPGAHPDLLLTVGVHMLDDQKRPCCIVSGQQHCQLLSLCRVGLMRRSLRVTSSLEA
jgi:hypothetical protein